jgi:hypothetical protein
MRCGPEPFPEVTLVAVGPATAEADSVLLHPVKDNTLFESATGSLSSGSGPAVFVGMNSASNVRRALLAFDVAGTLLEGSIIQSAELRLTVSNVPNPNPTLVEVHRVLADWGEGASSSSGGGGAPAESLDATWLHTFHPDAFWVAPGGDFDPAVHAAATIAGTGTFVWSDSALAVDVQAWLDDPSTNFGWMLRGDEATPASARRIDSREAPGPDTWPELVVQFQPGPTSMDRATWGRTKSFYRPD